jgi:type I pantothenate kinase
VVRALRKGSPRAAPRTGADPADTPVAHAAGDATGAGVSLPAMNSETGTEFSAYVVFGRDEWAALRASTPLTLSERDLAALAGVLEQVSLDDVVQIYLPLSRLLNLHFRSARALSGVKDEFLGRLVGRRPYVIGIAGSVAVGKSTFARTLQALLARWPDHPSVSLVTTDGFLYPNATLAERGLMKRKGFPESYDRRRMIEFLADLKAGKAQVEAPVYSHQAYDIVPGERERVVSPDILIFEGLNVLQTGTVDAGRSPSIIVSDFFDFSLYLDADEADIQSWYVRRFLKLQRTAFQNPSSYFHHYKDLDADRAREVALDIWRDINGVNLRENILPSRERAHVVLRKRADHGIGEVWLRQI